MDPSFIIILLFGAAALWFMSSRTRKQQQEAARFRDNLEAGQEVMTGSGLFGVVVEVEGDRVTLEISPGVTSQWLKPAIAKLVEPPFDDAEAADEDYEDGDEEYEDEEYADDELGEDVDDVVDEETEGEDVADEGTEEWEDVEVPDDASSLSPDEDDQKPR